MGCVFSIRSDVDLLVDMIYRIDAEYIQYLREYQPESEKSKEHRLKIRKMYSEMIQFYQKRKINPNSPKLSSCQKYLKQIPGLTPLEVERYIQELYETMRKKVLESNVSGDEPQEIYIKFLQMTDPYYYGRFLKRSDKILLSGSSVVDHVNALPKDYAAIFTFFYRNEIDSRD